MKSYAIDPPDFWADRDERDAQQADEVERLRAQAIEAARRDEATDKSAEQARWSELFAMLRRFDAGECAAESIVEELARQHWCARGGHWAPFAGVSVSGMCADCRETLVESDLERDVSR